MESGYSTKGHTFYGDVELRYHRNRKPIMCTCYSNIQKANFLDFQEMTVSGENETQEVMIVLIELVLFHSWLDRTITVIDFACLAFTAISKLIDQACF